jgi:hypothetical protein
LERLAAHAALHGPVLPRGGSNSSSSGSSSGNNSSGGSGSSSDQQRQQQQQIEGFGQLPLYVSPATPPSTGSSSSSSSSSSSPGDGGGGEAGPSGFEVAEGMCCLQVPVTAEPAAVYAFVQVGTGLSLRLP